MDDVEMQYIQQNLHLAERLLVFLQDRRLLRTRAHDEDFESCRESAQELRKVLEAELLAVRGKGFFFEALSDMQKACRIFVSAAGTNSQDFRRDPRLFVTHLNILRDVFSQRVRLIVERFDLTVSDELQALLDLSP